MAMNRQALAPFPALDRTHISFEICSDILPGIEPIGLIG
jgi:hypothetical protein